MDLGLWRKKIAGLDLRPYALRPSCRFPRPPVARASFFKAVRATPVRSTSNCKRGRHLGSGRDDLSFRGDAGGHGCTRSSHPAARSIAPRTGEVRRISGRGMIRKEAASPNVTSAVESPPLKATTVVSPPLCFRSLILTFKFAIKNIEIFRDFTRLQYKLQGRDQQGSI